MADRSEGRAAGADLARPVPLLLGTGVVAAQGLVLLGYGIWLLYELGSREPQNRAVAEGPAAFFGVLGLLVLAVAIALWRRRGWAAGAGNFLQLLSLPLAWYMAQERFWVGAVPLVALAVTGLYGLNTASSREALGR